LRESPWTAARTSRASGCSRVEMEFLARKLRTSGVWRLASGVWRLASGVDALPHGHRGPELAIQLILRGLVPTLWWFGPGVGLAGGQDPPHLVAGGGPSAEGARITLPGTARPSRSAWP